ncbi:aspartoacylase [Vibrio coralliilyticus]|uniref:aspartoacylase n=1 Tax=Vibrio coralliilyticus TaxID=190893 RepID=UPI00148B3FF1|nr:aspartoacylase [Vibrio coralliilyticus]NOI20475.1 aspartoacylase [Vibrio coralliilyticus]
MPKINQVLLVAGTHGNELTGLYLHKLIRDGHYPADRSTFEVKNVIGNPEAVERRVRFVESDLNREFSTKALSRASESKESELASKFSERYGDSQNQLIIDLHNTTSNMGATLILLSDDPFYNQMGSYVKHRMPSANILFEDRKPWHEQPYLCSVGQYGVMLEVGAQAHGALTYETLELMKNLLTAVLDFIELHNLGKAIHGTEYDAYRYLEDVAFPLDNDGMRIATVHPTICGKDFEVVKSGEPILATFNGYDVHWQGSNEVYPHFINESAYCSSNIAMALAEKIRVKI